MDTKRKYHEATQQTIRFFENVLDATEDGILITDFSNSIILVNQNFASIFEKTVKEMLETNLFVWLERVDPDAPKTWTFLFDRIHRKEAVKRFEYSIRKRCFEINGTMVGNGGDSQAVLWVWRDVSEHKLAEETLKKNEEKFGFQVDLIEPLKIHNRIVSSSLIRDLIREGNMQEVSKFLGRNYSLSGLVIKGHRIGRDIGFPTINIQPFEPHKLIPAIGVYISEIFVNSNKYIGVTNIGYSPTLKKISIKEVETNIIDFQGDLYDKKVEIVFHKRLREELLFTSKTELVDAIQNDVEKARRYFGMLLKHPV